jgi:hypothetical protein
MLVLNIYVKPYLAEYARRRYPGPINGTVMFPAASLVNHALVNSLTEKPTVDYGERKSNLQVIVNEKICDLKDVDRFNFLTYRGENNVGEKLLLDFDMFLHSYMDRQRYHNGVDYKGSAQTFVEKYGLTGMVTPEALLKKHVRWKKKVARYRTEGVQLKMEFKK